MHLSTPNTHLKCASLWLVVSFVSFSLTAQQLSIFTKYRDVLTIINPGAIPLDYFDDTEPTVFFGATVRDQWRAFGDGHPQTGILKADYVPIDKGSGGLLAGAYIIQDRIGIFETTGGYCKIAGVISLNTGELSLGLTLGIVQRRLTENPTGIVDSFSDVFPDVGAGIFYKRGVGPEDDFIYTGLSIPQVVGFDQDVTINGRNISITQVQHYYFTFGFLHYMLDRSSIEPSIWLKYVRNAPISVDLNLRIQLENRLSIGAGYSTESKSLNLTAHLIQILNSTSTILRIGFGFSVPFAGYGPQFGNSLEPHFNYSF